MSERGSRSWNSGGGSFGRDGARRGGGSSGDRDGGRDGGRGGGGGSTPTIPAGYEPAVFTPTRFGGVTGSPDLMLANSPWVVSNGPAAFNELRIFNVPNQPMVRRWELLIRDLSGGIGLPVTEIAQGFVPNAVGDSSLETRKPRTLSLLPLLETDTASGKLMGNEESLSVAFVPSEMQTVIVGGGDTADQALFELGDDEGDILITPITYTPGTGTPIISLAVARIATGTLNRDRLLIGRKGAVAQIYSFGGFPVTEFQEFTSSGNFVVPATVTEATIECWGGGGGGGGAVGDGDDEGAGGGGGGGAYNKAVVTVTPSDTLTVTVGAGGAGDTNGSGTGTSGGTSSVSDPNPTVLCSAPGGAGGSSSSGSTGSGGAGGNASSGVGDVGFDGGDGRAAFGGGFGSPSSGGGGGGAGDSANGSDGSGTSGGDGGNAGGGDGGNGRSSEGGGFDGSSRGGGGGGARSRSIGTPTQSGGDGADGFVRITYTIPATGSPTTTSMHADTANTWGAAVSPINEDNPGQTTLMIYAGNKLLSMDDSAAINAQPVELMDGLPEGGYIMGIARLQGQPIRLHIALPNTDDDTSTLSRADGFRIFHIDLEGASSGEFLDVGLPLVIHALIWRDGVVATDGQTVMWHNGTKQNLGALNQRVKAATVTLSILCLAVDQDRLFAFIKERTGTTVTRVWWEEYSPEQDEWHRITVPINTGGNQDILPFGGLTPIYKDFNRTFGSLAHRMFWYETGITEGWRSISLLPTAINPFYAQETSASNTAPRKWATTGTVTSPVMHMVGYEGVKKIVSDIWFGGELPTSTSGDSVVTVEIASQAKSTMSFGGPVGETFHERDRWEGLIAKFPDNTDIVDRLQYRITVTQSEAGSSPRTSPNALPIKIGGFLLLDGQVRTPAEIDPAYFGAEDD